MVGARSIAAPHDSGLVCGPACRAATYHPAMLTCNIDQRGRKVRLVIGAVIESTGLMLGVLWYLGMVPPETIWAAAGLWAGGMFMVIEGLLGWCALRALGVKTPI
jgi:hypothetical protein